MTSPDKNRSKSDSPILSPDELGRLIRVTEPRIFLAIGLGGMFIIGVMLWSVFGLIPYKIVCKGGLVSSNGVLEAIVLFPVQAGKHIKPGMNTSLYPATSGDEEYGYIYGLVDHIAAYPGTQDGVVWLTGKSQMVRAKIVLQKDTTPSGFKWSSSQGPDRALEAGTSAEATVVTGYSRPLDLVFSKLSAMFSSSESEYETTTDGISNKGVQ